MSRPNFERLVPPPRRVPFGVQVQTLFGATLARVGWWLLVVLSPVAWVFASQADLSGPLLFRGHPPAVEGRVTRLEETRSSEGGRRIVRVEYTFRAPGGPPLSGSSYSVGVTHAVGDVVQVEYLEGRPSISRISGARRAPFSAAVLLVLVFPAIGLGLAGLSLRSGRRTLRLLGEGQLGSASFLSQRPTDTKVNGQLVQELIFEYVGPDGLRRTLRETTIDPHPLRDERRETILFHPQEPERATLVDALPRAAAVDERGEIVQGAGSILVLLPALLAMLVNGAFAAYRLAR